jgi:hypothetical protein
MQCKKCDRAFLDDEWIASISGSIMGDEVTDSYYLCPVCGVYTVVHWWDNFTGDQAVPSILGQEVPLQGALRIFQQCTGLIDVVCCARFSEGE